MKRKLVASVFAVYALFLVACSDSGNDNLSAGTLLDVAADDGRFTTLVAALDAAGLSAVVDNDEAAFTLFAPTDAAFALLGQSTIDALLADPDALADVLLYHVVSGAEIDSTAAIAAAGTTVEMANGDFVGVSLNDEGLFTNLSLVIETDIQAGNGVIHVIDAVLIPPAELAPPIGTIVDVAVANGNFGTLVAAVQAAGLAATLADDSATFTVFAPTDAAFEAMGNANVAALLGDVDNLTDILLQHVVADVAVDAVTAYSLNALAAPTLSGQDIPVTIDGKRALRIGGAEVVITDIPATNGVIHVIDTVIVGSAGLPKPAENIAEVATAAGDFSLLLTALTTTGLDSVLTDPSGSFTVFAPTDAAFNELGMDTINALLADPDTLSDILLYHVIGGAEVLADGATSIAASNSSLVDMANMSQSALSLGEEGLVINLADIVTANVMAANGVIHVIDKVMLPPDMEGAPTDNIVDTAINAGNFTTLLTALQAAGLEDDLANEDTEFTVFAPTDAAFDLIDPEVLSGLLADTDALTNVLLQHVVEGSVNSVTALSLNGSSADTLAGDDVTLEVEDGVLRVQGSAISTFDIYTSNGIIHVIDAVITETLANE